MSRTAVPFAILVALSGCFSVSDVGYEPNVSRPVKADPVRVAWRNPDGTLATSPAATDAPARPQAPVGMQASLAGPAKGVSAAGATLPKTPADGPAALPRPESGNDTLIKATYTEAPRCGVGAEAAGPAGSCDLGKYPLPRIVAGKTATEQAPTAPAATPTTTTLASASPHTVLRLVNSRRIAFHFEVKDTGTSGPVTVEVWGSQDLKTWKKYDAVSQKGKTYIIEVKEEGLYGFTLLARTGSGGKERPRSGEAPQVWVAVDYTRPEVQFVGAELNILARTPTLVIRWTATDKNLGPRPVTLLYAEHAEGPWTVLAGNVENTGHYEWPLPAALPSGLYLRMQASDLMGNVGQAQTPNLLHNLQAAAVAASPTRGKEPTRETAPTVREPEPPRLRALPPTPALDLTHVPTPVAEPARTQISIVSVESERN